MSSLVGDFFVGILMLSQFVIHCVVKWILFCIIYCALLPFVLACDGGYYVKNGVERNPTLLKQLQDWLDSMWSFGLINPWSNNDK